jgi:hypothetical protein
MKPVLFIVALFNCLCLSAQKVDLYFPHFSGSEYVYILFQGVRSDTIQKGKIGADGRLSLLLPENRKDYRGIASWVLAGGGGLSFILSDEDFSISCTEKAPSANNIIYSASVENDRLRKLNDDQSLLLQKANLIFQGMVLYADNKKLSSIFDKESAELKKTFTRLYQNSQTPKSYATDYFHISNFLNNIGSHLYTPEEKTGQKADLVRFIQEDLNIDVLFTSGYWNPVISGTFDLFPDKKDFADAMVSNLKRTQSQQVFEQLSNDLLMICEQFNWPEAEDSIVSYLKTSGRIEQPQGRIFIAFERSKVKTGSKAMPIAGIADLSNSLLLFYDSECDNCRMQIEAVKEHYVELQSKGIRIISIAADTDIMKYTSYANSFPWKDKLCDSQSFAGQNFINFGVFGTPTLILINEKGEIAGRYARLEEISF